MGKITIGFGVLLIVLGVGVYLGLSATEDASPSKTALIPAFFGLPILLLGIVALSERWRMHAMHVVAMLALLGFLAPAGRLLMQLMRGADVAPLAMISMVSMALLCVGLFGVCFKSFFDARIRRIANENAE